MKKKNCWEAKKCGREPGGKNADKEGVCKSALPGLYDGVNNGKNQGRFCWAVAGNICLAEVTGTYSKFIKCVSCDFFKKVHDEEGTDFIHKPSDIKKEKPRSVK